jgi:hypothetical protein
MNKNTRKTYLILVFFISSSFLFCQNVAINTSGNAAYTSAILDLSNQNTTGSVGFLPPYVTLTGLNSFGLIGTASQSNGLIVYNTGGTVPAGLYYWNNGGGAWISMTGGVSSLTGTAPIVVSPATGVPGISLQGTAGAVCFGTGGGSNFNAAGTSGQFLQSAGAGTPVWTNLDTYVSVYPVTTYGTTAGSFSNNTNTFNTVTGANITLAAGTYIIIVTGDVGHSSCTVGAKLQLVDGSSTIYDIIEPSTPYYGAGYVDYPWTMSVEVSPASSTTYSVQMASNTTLCGAGTAYCNNIRMSAIRVH